MARSIHIVGAGLAGLAAAVGLAGSSAQVIVHEATAQPGGRCRSYYDHATDLLIDNGNHLLLSGNHAALAYLRTIGSEHGLVGPATAEFPFIDLATRKRWTLRLNDGRVPWWIFDANRRVPETRAADYLELARLLWAPDDKSIGQLIRCAGPLYERLVHPLLLAALNIDPREGSAALAAAVIRETLAAGGKACRPCIAGAGLGKVFIEPAIHHLRERGAAIRMEHELRALRFTDKRVSQLDFGEECIALAANDAVVLAVPPYAAAALIPELRTPSSFRAIVNAHFRADPPPAMPPMIGVLNGTTEWIFAFPGRLAVTTSNADRLLDKPRAALAHAIWQEVGIVTGLSSELPPWQIVRERRATFAATPEEDAKRPGAQTAWSNLFLAGDWTATGLPATIESAVRSGHRAAELVTEMMGISHV
jgi:squalene-associated FAD-dependent desaturase